MPIIKFKLRRGKKERKDKDKSIQNESNESTPTSRSLSETSLFPDKPSKGSNGSLKHRRFSLNRLLHDHHSHKLPAVEEETKTLEVATPTPVPTAPRPIRSSSYAGGLCGLENSSEWRKSEINQLDNYMKHARQSPSEDDLYFLPNRLCCAKILKVFFWREEQMYMNNLLHGRPTTRRRPNSKRRQSCSDASTGSPKKSTSGSDPTLDDNPGHLGLGENQKRRKPPLLKSKTCPNMFGNNSNNNEEFLESQFQKMCVCDDTNGVSETQDEDDDYDDDDDDDDEDDTHDDNLDETLNWLSYGSDKHKEQKSIPPVFDIY